MPEAINTAPLQDLDSSKDRNSSLKTMVKVDNVSMVFNMASEQLNSLKEYAIAMMRRELRFKEFRALDSVSLEVKKGDVYGILGTNGSGKSTLLKIIAGVLNPTEGTVEIGGNIAPLIELGAGFDLELTARENIYLNGALLGYSKKFLDEHFDDIVEFAEIEKFLDMPMKNYSSGMVARIAFAIATVIIPDILIVDEVLSVGDFMFQQKCERRISSLIKEHNVTVLIVSHSNDQIERLCNKAIWIEKGHTRMIGDAYDVCQTYRLLGGHVGTPESEHTIYSLLKDDIHVPSHIIETITGEDRYGTAVSLMEKAEYAPGGPVIIVPGEHAAPCMMATGLSGVLDAPVLLTKPDVLPDVVSQWLKHFQPSRFVVIGGENLVGPSVKESLLRLNPEAAFDRISGINWPEIAVNVYNYGLNSSDKTWGSTAILTYDGCNGDLLSLSPYTWLNRAPVFFIDDMRRVTGEVVATLQNGTLKHLFALGGEWHFSDQSLDEIAKDKLTWERIAGKDYYDANELINEMLETHLMETSEPVSRFVVSAAWNPADAFALGAYLGKTGTSVLLEDPQNLDSVAHAIEYIGKKAGGIKSLSFLGDHTRFSELDKSILGKAIARQQ